jgi:probable addiction module antidote protein
LEIAFNEAFKTADPKAICDVLDNFVRSWSISRVAKDVGVDRSVLYRSFRGKKGPRLSLVIGVLRSAGFRLVVTFERQPKVDKQPNRYGQGSKTTAHRELRGNPMASAQFLTRAFASGSTAEIGTALASVLRAQENVVEFTKRAALERSSLYRSFSPHRDPQLYTVVNFLSALGLRLTAVPAAQGQDDPQAVEEICHVARET